MSEGKTFAEIVKRVRRECNSYPLPNAAGEKLKLVREIDDAHKREIAAKDAEIASLKKSVERWMQYHETAKGERDACLDELKKRDAEIEKLKAYIAENDINGDTAVACLTEIKKAAEEKMAEIERLRALVGELADALNASCDCHRPCDGCEMADESKFDCAEKAERKLVARAREACK